MLEGGKYSLWRYVEGQGLVVVRADVRPEIGGYRSQKKYGRPDYCPTGTRWHRKAFKEIGKYPNLVWFESVLAAVAAHYSPCGNCWLRGDEAWKRWEEYVVACERLRVEPVSRPIRLR